MQRHRPAFFLSLVFAALFPAVFLLTGCGSGYPTGQGGPGITINLNNASVAVGSTMQLQATLSLNGSTTDVTSQVSWSSSSPQTATISASGMAKGIGVGKTTISANLNGVSGTADLNVVSAGPSSLTLSPQGAIVPAGLTQQFTAIGNYASGSPADLTRSVAWSVSPASVASISPSGLLSAIAPGSFTITATSGSVSANVTGIAGAAIATAVTITPATLSIASGDAQQFHAMAQLSDGSQQDVTSAVQWQSSNSAVAAISTAGLLQAKSTGPVLITATIPATASSAAVSSSATVSVTAATFSLLAVTPINPSVAVGATAQLTAMATYSDGSTQNLTGNSIWSSSDATVATVNAAGVVTGVAEGAVTITAQNGGKTASTKITVGTGLISISIAPGTASIAKGATQQFTALGLYVDGSTRDITSMATWSSSNASVISVNAGGLATGTGIGSAQVSASYLGKIATTGTLQGTPAALVSVAVSPGSPTISAGSTQQFTATGTYTDGTTQNLTSSITWASSNTSILSIDATGLATAHTVASATTATLSATMGAVTKSITVAVQPAGGPTMTGITILPTSARIAAGTPTKLMAMATYSDGTQQDVSGSVVWSSTNISVATVDTTGLATGLAVGTATIQAQLNSFQSQTTLIVSSATLVSLSITPNLAGFALGTSEQFQVTGTFSDGTKQNLTIGATWQSSATSVATVSQSGLVQSVSVGMVMISATFGGQTAMTSALQVTPATLVSVILNPTTILLHKGTSQQLSVVGTFSDGTTQDISGLATWQSTDNTIVAISSTGMATAVGVGTIQVSGTVNGMTATSASFQVTPATLASMAITPTTPSFAVDTTQQFAVTGTYSDTTTQDLSMQAVWSSSNPQVATIDQNGLAEGGSIGSTQISAAFEGITATTGTVQVTPATLISITITPGVGSIVKGLTQQLTATGLFSDGTTQDLTNLVTWATSDPTIISISGSGVALGTGIGFVSITATYQGVSATASLGQGLAAALVSITVTPSTTSIAAGLTQQFIATGTYTDGTTLDLSASATWSSSNTGAATIDLSGLVLGQLSGTTTIQAQSSGITGSATLTVSPAILTLLTITPSATSVAKGTTLQLIATAHYSDGTSTDVTAGTSWSAAIPTIANISPGGLLSALLGGSTQISGTYMGYTAVVSLAVSPANLVSLSLSPGSVSIANGTAQALHVTGTFTDGSTQDLSSSVAWSSSSSVVATVDVLGNISTHSVGSATITAQTGGFNAFISLNVTSAVPQTLQLTPASISLPAGGTQQLLITANFTDGTSQDVTTSAIYTSSDAGIATVSAQGKLLANNMGSATIAVTLGGLSYNLPVTVTAATLQSLTIAPASLNLASGLTQQLMVTGLFSDGSTSDMTQSVTWSSSDSAKATVSATGSLLAMAQGNVTITAQAGGVSATLPVTITAATVLSVTITPSSITLDAGQVQQLSAIANFSDGTQQTVTSAASWSVSDPSVANISNTAGLNGLLSVIATGNITVYATLGSTVGSAALSIQPATVTALSITPNPISLAAGTSQSLTVTGNYSDGSNANLNASTTWSSSNLGVVSVSSSGLVTATGTGAAVLTATAQGVSTTVSVTVTSAVLQSISVTATGTSANLGEQPQVTATGTYSDGSTEDITTQAHWSSSDSSIAVVGSTGLITTKGIGTTTISATLGGVSAQVTLTVNPATLTSIAVQASQTSFALGTSLQLTAIGTYSDGSTTDLTQQVSWSSLNGTVGVISTTGLATGSSTGSFAAKAALGGVSGTLSVTVTSAVIQSITLSPANSIIVDILGNSATFVATGHFSDGTTAVLGSGVHWAITSGIALGSISQSGVFSPIALGIGTVTATYSGVSGSTGFTIIGL